MQTIEKKTTRTGYNYELLTPHKTIGQKVGRKKGKEAKINPIEEAEKLLEDYIENSQDVILIEISRLQTAWSELGEKRLSDDERKNLLVCANDVKGIGSTFDYPKVTEVAGSLCHLLDNIEDTSKLPAALIDQHVKAVRAIVAENARGHDNPLACRMSERLWDVTTEYVASVQAK